MKKLSGLFIVSAFICSLVGIANAGLNDGLVAYYPFSGNANDESRHGYHGTVYGATLTKDRFDNTNSAYEFNGNDFISGYLSENIDDLTISYWIKTRQDKRACHVALETGRTNIYCVMENHLRFGAVSILAEDIVDWWQPIAGFVPLPIAGRDQIYTQGSYADNQWHHVLALRQGSGASNLKIYIDGLYVQTDVYKNDEVNPNFNGMNLTFGATRNSNHFFQGILDDIRIYNRVLSDLEIKQLFWGGGRSDFDVIINSSDWTIKIPCAELGNDKYGFDLKYYDAPNDYDPIGYWKLDMNSVRLVD